MEFVPFY